jgi:ABC-type sugar transport system ATPase subunit
MCHRAVVIREGTLARIFAKGELTEENLIAAAVGHMAGGE